LYKQTQRTDRITRVTKMTNNEPRRKHTFQISNRWPR